jgi:prepilin-type N-terminal cleavage/methylation domain-containing protein
MQKHHGGARPPAPRGFTLIEVIVALVLLAVGLLALLGATTALNRQAALAQQLGVGALAAQSRLEWLRTRPCADLHDSAGAARGIQERWHVETVDSSTRVVTVIVRAARRATDDTLRTAVAC